jgi:tRNA modification GTPase
MTNPEFIMYDLNDTIIAVSSATSDQRVIIRLSGGGTIEKLNLFFTPNINADRSGIIRGKLKIDDELKIEAVVYVFAEGRSYTGETCGEIQFWSNRCVTESVINSFLENGVRMAGAGEFTARAYMNGKLDLAQAEAVNKVITCSNRLQIGAAQKLLAGRLTDTVGQVKAELIECLSRLEAGMDFSEEDIEFIRADDAAAMLESVKQHLEKLVSGGISYEVISDLPSVGIAGAVNAGKSSLLNALLERDRSIVSSQQKTTRDILTGILELEHNRCVLFDCAGLLSQTQGQIDELAQSAAVEALNTAEVVIFCVDIIKDDHSEDADIRKLINADRMITVATKTDLLDEKQSKEQLKKLKKKFESDFIAISSRNNEGLIAVKEMIDKNLAISSSAESRNAGVLLTARHKQAVNHAVDNISQAIGEIRQGNAEVASIMIRAAWQDLSKMETAHIDEKILDNIFSQFCVGK